jgi:hypothetical protein
MDDNFNILEIINQQKLNKLEKLTNIHIENITQLSTKYLVSYSNTKPLLGWRSNESITNTHNINIPIASAVTAYARIHMSQFKINKDLPNLYYSDTCQRLVHTSMLLYQILLLVQLN